MAYFFTTIPLLSHNAEIYEVLCKHLISHDFRFEVKVIGDGGLGYIS